MRVNLTTSTAALVVGLSLPVLAAAQTTIFTTSDFHQDRERWTDPVYRLEGSRRATAVCIVVQG